jgi:DNA-binding NarL/FixJ family response regulator
MNDIVKAGLTPQQRKVAEGLLDGLRNAEIAKRIGLGERSVKAHLAHMYAGFQIQTPSFYASTASSDACAKRILLARKLLCA